MALSYGIGGPGTNASWAGPPPVDARGGGNSLDERRRQLLEWLAGRGAASPGFQGLHAGSAIGRMGGIGGRAPLPAMSYNPFLAQIAGRNENFNQLPAGVTAAQAQRVQQGPVGPGLGVQGVGGVNIPDAAPGVVQPTGGAAPRSLVGVGGTNSGIAPPPPTASNGQVSTYGPDAVSANGTVMNLQGYGVPSPIIDPRVLRFSNSGLARY